MRDRRADIPILFNSYMKRFSQRLGRPARPLTASILRACLHHEWPGNVRELINFVQRYLVLGEDSITPCCLENCAVDTKIVVSPGVPNLKQLVRAAKQQVETRAITQVLNDTNGHRGRAAKALGISTKALLYKLRHYRIAPPVNKRVPRIPAYMS